MLRLDGKCAPRRSRLALRFSRIAVLDQRGARSASGDRGTFEQCSDARKSIDTDCYIRPDAGMQGTRGVPSAVSGSETSGLEQLVAASAFAVATSMPTPPPE